MSSTDTKAEFQASMQATIVDLDVPVPDEPEQDRTPDEHVCVYDEEQDKMVVVSARILEERRQKWARIFEREGEIALEEERRYALLAMGMSDSIWKDKALQSQQEEEARVSDDQQNNV
jgi:hypothetical protein